MFFTLLEVSPIESWSPYPRSEKANHSVELVPILTLMPEIHGDRRVVDRFSQPQSRAGSR